jgi:NAD+ synthetase
MARERMTILYDHSACWNALVLGTSNKTELLLGYGTLYGDMASAVNPLGDLYKLQVWALAEAVGVPLAIVKKAPSADLWHGQTDEGDLGFSYREVDHLLYLMVDQRYTRAELIAAGFAGASSMISSRIMNSQPSGACRSLPKSPSAPSTAISAIRGTGGSRKVRSKGSVRFNHCSLLTVLLLAGRER